MLGTDSWTRQQHQQCHQSLSRLFTPNLVLQVHRPPLLVPQSCIPLPEVEHLCYWCKYLDIVIHRSYRRQPQTQVLPWDSKVVPRPWRGALVATLMMKPKVNLNPTQPAWTVKRERRVASPSKPSSFRVPRLYFWLRCLLHFVISMCISWLKTCFLMSWRLAMLSLPVSSAPVSREGSLHFRLRTSSINPYVMTFNSLTLANNFLLDYPWCLCLPIVLQSQSPWCCPVPLRLQWQGQGRHQEHCSSCSQLPMLPLWIFWRAPWASK